MPCDSLMFMPPTTQTDSLHQCTENQLFSSVYTNFNSFIPNSYKFSLVSTLLYRAHAICSGWRQIDTEFVQIRTFMTRNGFPALLVDKIIAKFLNKVHSRTAPEQESTTDKFTLVLPYLGSCTNQIEKRIKQSLKQHLPEVHLRVVYRASTRLRSMFSFKDKIPSYFQSNVVYKYKCGRCNSTYVGETVRHAKSRFCEHMGVSHLTGKQMARIVPSAVNQHTAVCKHPVKYTDFKILCKDNVGGTSRQIKETLFIRKENPDLNDRRASVTLNLF